MSSRTNNLGKEGSTRRAVDLASWRRRESGSSDDTKHSSAPETGGLESWLKEFDDGKSTAGTKTPSILSAFSRITYTAAPNAVPGGSTVATTTPDVSPARSALSCEDLRASEVPVSTCSSWMPSGPGATGLASSTTELPGRSPPSLMHSTDPSGLGISCPSTSHRPTSSTKSPVRPLAPFSSYVPPRLEYHINGFKKSKATPSRNQPGSSLPSDIAAPRSQSRKAVSFTTESGPYPSPFTAFFPLENRQPCSVFTPPMPTQTTTEQAPVLSWDSTTLTRDWTPDQVLLGLSRIFSELNLDFYEEHHLKINYDGNPQAVVKVWADTKLAYDAFLNSNATGLDMLTILMLKGNTIENVKGVLANMICFFAAGKMGMEGRAESFAKALISGGYIVCFVQLRCVESGLVYPGGTGQTKQRIIRLKRLMNGGQ